MGDVLHGNEPPGPVKCWATGGFSTRTQLHGVILSRLCPGAIYANVAEYYRPEPIYGEVIKKYFITSRTRPRVAVAQSG
jgi:hypothetical protein